MHQGLDAAFIIFFGVVLKPTGAAEQRREIKSGMFTQGFYSQRKGRRCVVQRGFLTSELLSVSLVLLGQPGEDFPRRKSLGGVAATAGKRWTCV